MKEHMTIGSLSVARSRPDSGKAGLHLSKLFFDEIRNLGI
jgi:hypothetical protein